MTKSFILEIVKIDEDKIYGDCGDRFDRTGYIKSIASYCKEI